MADINELIARHPETWAKNRVERKDFKTKEEALIEDIANIAGALRKRAWSSRWHKLLKLFGIGVGADPFLRECYEELSNALGEFNDKAYRRPNIRAEQDPVTGRIRHFRNDDGSEVG